MAVPYRRTFPDLVEAEEASRKRGGDLLVFIKSMVFYYPFFQLSLAAEMCVGGRGYSR
jgi:hypothetical protein